MSKSAAWSSCNHILQERWQSAQLESHRARLEAIHATPSKIAQHGIASTPIAAAVYPYRGTVRVQTAVESKSPVAKARQAQIDRDTLNLVKKIMATELPRPQQSGGKARSPVDRTGAHRCTHQLPDVPSAACHPLYTRRSNTMRVNFADQNEPTAAHHFREEARHRAQAKILSENRKIAQRIASTPASVSRAAWRDHELEHLKLRQAISKSASKLSQSMSRNSSRSCGGLRPAEEGRSSMMAIADNDQKKRPKSAKLLRNCSWAVENRHHSVEHLPLRRSSLTDSDSIAAQLGSLAIESIL